MDNDTSLVNSLLIFVGVKLVKNEDYDYVEAATCLIACLISMVLLVITFFIYVVIPELRNLQGKCLLGYCTVLILPYTCMMFWDITATSRDGQEEMIRDDCKTIIFVSSFSYLTSCSWLSVMGFDIWRKFRVLKTVDRLKRYKPNKRFHVYAIFAYGLPLLCTIFGALLDYVLKISCEKSLMVMASFILAMLSCNIIFFISTTLKLLREKRKINKTLSMDENSRNQSSWKKLNENYMLYLRLFLLMNGTWIATLLLFEISPEHSYRQGAFKLIHSSILFILFVLKPNVIELVKNRWNNGSNRLSRESTATTDTGSKKIDECKY